MQSSAEPAAVGAPVRDAGGSARPLAHRIYRFGRMYWLDIAWAAFVALNLIAMRLNPAWGSVPFLVIWVSLTAVYGFRLWHLGSTVLTVGIVTLATGGIIGLQVVRGEQDADYLAEVPLLAAMFVIMVWHARRRQAAMEEIKRALEHNRPLLGQPASVPPGRLPRAGHAQSPSLSAMPSSSPTPPPTRPSPRTPG